MPNQNNPTIDVIPIFNATLVTGNYILQIYFELYTLAPAGFQTYTLEIDGVGVNSFQAGISLGNARFTYNYTFVGPITAGLHSFRVTGAGSSSLITDSGDSYQALLTQSI